MAIMLQSTLSKKIQLPGYDFSSNSASFTISAEVTSLADIPAEAARLYQIAEAAVDAQLGLTNPPGTRQGHSEHPHQAGLTPAPMAAQPLSSSQPAETKFTGSAPSRASMPYRAPRRAPALITQSQMNYIERLLNDTQTPLATVLEGYRVAALSDLTCKMAAETIDTLKGAVRA